METDIPTMRSVSFLEKMGITENLPEKGEYTINARHYGRGAIKEITDNIMCILGRFGYKGRVFKAKNHKYATLDEDAVRALKTSCGFFGKK